MSELVELPPTWHASAWPTGWDFEKNCYPDPALKRVGYVLLPEQFHLVLHWPELSEGVEDEEDDPTGLIMTFGVEGDELVTREIYGVQADLTEWMGYLIQHFPPEKWKAFAVAEMTQFLAVEEKRKNRPTLTPRASSRDAGQPLRGGERRAAGAPEGRKRYRITPEHLDTVAKVYKEATERGVPPTRAVSEHFAVAHSTAAKWVGAARRAGSLPAHGEKEGE